MKFVLGLLAAMMILFAVFAVADPQGAALTRGASSRGAGTAATSQAAEDGNVTVLNILQDRITDVWQGFYGNVSGSIVLENAAGNNFYDWNYVNVSGEVYASRRAVSSWSTVNCTNSTFWQNEETGLAISSTAPDGVNETYSVQTHPTFQVAGRTMTGCQSTRPYNNTGIGDAFWNVLLSLDSTSVIYTALLAGNENNFANGISDYEILVPVNRTTGTATYFFYAELH
jgi:hypothetical protein